MDAATIREGAITAHHRTPAESRVTRALAEALRREGSLSSPLLNQITGVGEGAIRRRADCVYSDGR